jgi:hypothetical protein
MNYIKLLLLLSFFIFFLLSCSKNDNKNDGKVVTEVKKHSSLFIKYKAEYNFGKNDSVYVFELIPTLNPCGNISLLSVQNGKSKKLQTLRFKGMRKPGTLAIKRTAKEIILGYDLDCWEIMFAKSKVTIPQNAKYMSSGYMSEVTDGVFWNITFFIEDRPLEWTSGSSLDIFIDSSKKAPSTISYIVSIEMEKTPNK